VRPPPLDYAPPATARTPLWVRVGRIVSLTVLLGVVTYWLLAFMGAFADL
jgi:hypothetical protein